MVDLEPISGTDAAGQIASIESIMGRYGDGARAVIRVRWDNGGGGHVFIAEQVSGETRVVDPQSGSSDCSGYMADALPGFTRLLRIDDAKLSSLIGKAVRNRRAP